MSPFDEWWATANDGRYGKEMARKSYNAGRLAGLQRAAEIARAHAGCELCDHDKEIADAIDREAETKGRVG